MVLSLQVYSRNSAYSLDEPDAMLSPINEHSARNPWKELLKERVGIGGIADSVVYRAALRY